MSDKADILLVVESVSNEKGVSKDVIFVAMESALAAVIARQFGGEEQVNVRVTIDRTTGEYAAERYWTVISDEAADSDPEVAEAPEKFIKLSDAQQHADIEEGGEITEPLESVPFGRIAAHQAKQVITRIVRDAERAKLAAQYETRVGELINGQVKKVTREAITIELNDQVEAMVPRHEMIPRESVRTGDRLRAYIYGINPENRGPLVLLSRTCPEMLVELFKIEVPEINEGVIQIKAAARDPGARAKVAVKTNDSRMDPIGACVGMRGSRVQAVSSELNGERVDIILWNDNPAHLAISAMAPAEVQSIRVNEELRSMDVIVDEDQLSQAIGRGGQNVRLASELVGWTLNVMTEADALASGNAADAQSQLMILLDIDEGITEVLSREGYTTLEHIVQADAGQMAEIEEFDENIVEELKNRAQSALITQAMTADTPEPAEDLLALDGMTTEIAEALAAQGVVTQEDLADQAIDDIVDIEGLDNETAGALIMAARAPWFEDEDSAE